MRIEGARRCLIGSSESTVTSAACGNVCSGLTVSSTRLDILVPMSLK